MKIRKTVLIVNGKPRAGKDTFVEILNDFIPTYKYSMIEKVKSMALDCGYKASKDEKDRKFLYELKKLTDEYSDMSMRDVKDRVWEFAAHNIKELIMVIDARDPKDIEHLAYITGGFTVFIDNENVPAITSNEADANVDNYEYDFYIKNDGTLKDFEENVYNFFVALIKLIEVPEQ